MAYNLDSKMKYENNITLKECLDTKFYKWKAFVFKNPDWYQQDVKDYIEEVLFKSSRNHSLNSSYKTKVSLKYT